MNKRILFIVSEDHYFVSHRLHLGKAAINEGYKVGILCHLSNYHHKIKKSGIKIFNWFLVRSSLNPFQELYSIMQVVFTIRQFMPDVIHAVAIKPIIYSAIASRICMLESRVFAFGGLGYIFSSNTIKSRIYKTILILLLRILLRGEKTVILLQNSDDYNILKSYKIVNNNNTRIIRGSGVDTNLFSPKKLNVGNIPTVILPARMLWDKGVKEFVNCAVNIKQKNNNVRFVLVGSPDNHNPESISYDQLKKWDNHGIIEWWDYRDDMHNIYQMAQLVCLPSYREGLPKSLLEAASCEIPIVAFDVPGCREIVIDGMNGILVPFKDESLFCNAVEKIITNPKLGKKYGKAGRKYVLKNFSQEQVANETINVWKSVSN